MAQTDWETEITPEPAARTASDTGMGGMNRMPAAAGGAREMAGTGGGTEMMPAPYMARTGLPDEVIEAPLTVEEAYRGSMKAMLARNVGNYVVATFLVGTSGTVSWEGILYDVGNDFITIYQEPRDRYIVTDIYSLKYIEFYDTRRRELCERLMREQGRL